MSKHNNIDKLIQLCIANRLCWLNSDSGLTSVVISTRFRLARNIAHYNFPVKANKKELAEIKEECLKAVLNTKDAYYWQHVLMDELDNKTKDLLISEHLISPKLAYASKEAAVAISPDKKTSVMVNEEDHLRIQVLDSGLQLQKSWKAISEFDDQLLKTLPVAYSEKTGFLTSCPTNMGTGLRVSVMMHLPALVLSKEITKIIESCKEMKISIRGIMGEGSIAVGNLFQISNQATLGVSEIEIINKIEKVINKITTLEENSRKRIMHEKRIMALDFVGRAYGNLKNCYIMDYSGAMSGLSAIAFGISTGLIKKSDKTQIVELVKGIQTSTIETLFENICHSEEAIDIKRAELLRKSLV